MTNRRPRNEISRTRALADACADLLDCGLGDEAAADRMTASFKRTITARSVRSFRKASYEPIARDRMSRRYTAERVRLLLSGAAGTYAQAGQELLSKMLFDLLESGGLEARELVAAGKTFAKIREIEIASIKAESERKRSEAAAAAETVLEDRTLSESDRKAAMRRILGLE